MLLVRLGGNGIEYTGDVYVTNIKLDSTALALADIDLEVLASSYGDGLAGVEVSNFDGMDALHIQTKFANVNGNWQEVTSRIDVKGINIADTLTSNFAAKLSAVEHIVEYDKDILALKAENNTLNTALTNETSEVRSKIEELTNTQKLTMSTLIYVVFIVGAVLVVLLTIFVITSVQKSIKKFKGTLTHISEGEITVKAETGSGDEFDTFGRSLNRMTDKLSDVITNVKQYGIELKNSGAELETMSRGSEQTSEHIDAAISEIALGATNQARDVENSTNEIVNLGQLMDTMDADISELDETSINMKQASDEAVTILSALSRSNGNMTEGIHRIAQQITRTNDSVKEIEEAASLISSIADQTNLLSLNSSIEAARAGEAGKGFAVVASEIQQLADQSNKSADSIFGIITNLINEFKETLDTMSEVETATNDQNQKLADTQKQFEIVNEGIAQSRDKTAVIKGAISECNHVRNTVSEIMLNLSAISEQNAASATETATAMQQLNTTISELLQESQKLLTISSQLEQDMTFFKIG